jgi:ABC-type Na+ efflux pump permease subunit
MLMAVAVRAATAISGERERQTFDGLVASPLGAAEILWAKFFGSILSVRLAWLWLLAIWALGLGTEGLNPLALGFLMASWFVYAAALALLGLWFSLVCRTSTRAILATLGTALALSFGHWLPWMCCAFGAVGGMFFGRGQEDLLLVQAGATPPMALAIFAFMAEDFQHNPHAVKMIILPNVGLGAWAVGAFGLWSVLYQRFCNETNRETLFTLVRDAEWRPAPPRNAPERPPARLSGATLIEDTAPAAKPPAPTPPPRGSGARLIEEAWEPPRLPAPPREE